MKRWPNKLFFLGGIAALGMAIPALSQDSDAPESLLPPGFEDPQPAPADPTNVQAPVPAPPSPTRPPVAETQIRVSDASEEDLESIEDLNLPPPIEIPDFARRSSDVVGPLDSSNWGLGEQAFGGADGRFLSTLMRRLDAPLPSRWTSILLRRALLSRIPAPANVQPVDWVAERALLL